MPERQIHASHRENVTFATQETDHQIALQHNSVVITLTMGCHERLCFGSQRRLVTLLVFILWSSYRIAQWIGVDSHLGIRALIPVNTIQLVGGIRKGIRPKMLNCYRRLVECSELQDTQHQYFRIFSLKDFLESVDCHSIIDFVKEVHFYRATLCQRGITAVAVIVCLSV